MVIFLGFELQNSGHCFRTFYHLFASYLVFWQEAVIIPTATFASKETQVPSNCVGVLQDIGFRSLLLGLRLHPYVYLSCFFYYSFILSIAAKPRWSKSSNNKSLDLRDDYNQCFTYTGGIPTMGPHQTKTYRHPKHLDTCSNCSFKRGFDLQNSTDKHKRVLVSNGGRHKQMWCLDPG